ncbi:MAG: GntR family transcriptional regulator [Micromonosporaceae bacterium]
MAKQRSSTASHALARVESQDMPEQPLYEQVHNALRDQIRSGVYRSGSRLPSERSLSEAFRVSRLTLRRALQDLADAGVLDRSSSRGWFVAAEPMSEAPNQLLGFSAMARSRGLTPSARVVIATSREATLDEAETLSVAPGAPLFHLERLRLMDDVPIAVDGTLLPLTVAPWLPEVDFTQNSLYDLLEEHGTVPTRASYVVEVREADERLAGLLDVPVGKGLLMTSGLTSDQHGRLIEHAWIAYRPERYRLRTTLVRGSS